MPPYRGERRPARETMLRHLAIAFSFVPALAAQAAWTRQYPVQAPAARVGSASANDVLLNCALLFGGRQSSGPSVFGDTWRWNGQTWTQLPGVGPSPRSGAAMAFDALLRRVVLFGGMNASNVALQDTWEWDGSAWNNRLPMLQPSPRTSPGMAYDYARGAVLLFGGSNQSTSFGDLWEWDGFISSWIPFPAVGGPSPRAQPAMAFDWSSMRMLLF